MSKGTEFYDTTFNELLKTKDIESAGRMAKTALEDRELGLYDSATELDAFANNIRERYRRIIARPFIGPFGYCVIMVDKSFAKEWVEWLKTRGFDEQL